jgi:hypothetical protein
MKLSTETNEEIQKRIEKNDEKWKIGKSVTCHLVTSEKTKPVQIKEQDVNTSYLPY